MTPDEQAALLLRAETAEALLADVTSECERLAAEVEDLREQLAGKPKPEPSPNVGIKLMDPKEAEDRLAEEMMRMLFDGDQWKIEELVKLGKRERYDVMYGANPMRPRGPVKPWIVEIKRSLEFDRVHIRARHPHNKDLDWSMVEDYETVMNAGSHRYLAEKFAEGCARRGGLMTHEKERLRDCVRYELSKTFNKEGRF